MDLINFVNNFAAQHAWVGLVIAILIALHTGLKALRDALDTTPQTDDNWFERGITIMGKVVGYLAGFRAKSNP